VIAVPSIHCKYSLALLQFSAISRKPEFPNKATGSRDFPSLYELTRPRIVQFFICISVGLFKRFCTFLYGIFENQITKSVNINNLTSQVIHRFLQFWKFTFVIIKISLPRFLKSKPLAKWAATGAKIISRVKCAANLRKKKFVT